MRAVIITKSAMEKNHIRGACTTAMDINSGRMVRFVSNMQGAPIPYSVSDRFEKMDLVEVEILRSCPRAPQTENFLVNLTSFRVVQRGNCRIQNIYQRYLLNQPLTRFLARGRHKLDSVDTYNHSLEMAYVTDFTLEKTNFGRVKASFRIGYSLYRYFSVTDLDYDLRKSEANSKNFGNGWIVASIPTEPLIREGQNMGYFIFVAAFYPES